MLLLKLRQRRNLLLNPRHEPVHDRQRGGSVTRQTDEPDADPPNASEVPKRTRTGSSSLSQGSTKSMAYLL
ncbi:MAG: hypothetical protein CMQ05_12980 [Gammaproteobacteria bacterium]|nr:hypothetical protein [Gammaproteobacteria bacterium]